MTAPVSSAADLGTYVPADCRVAQALGCASLTVRHGELASDRVQLTGAGRGPAARWDCSTGGPVPVDSLLP
ncbi:hypothetical protein ACIQNI_29745 [Streptomyces sp. NPDC091266]|uniref:hypothetical protein n=1 Tax=Streptomyces sp. NPDC091266 TaxID=3365978 RepID=UPI003819F16A